MPGRFELHELCRPHLVLANLGGDVNVVAILGQLVKPVDGVLRLDDVAGLLVMQAVP